MGRKEQLQHLQEIELQLGTRQRQHRLASRRPLAALYRHRTGLLLGGGVVAGFLLSRAGGRRALSLTTSLGLSFLRMQPQLWSIGE